MPSLLLSRMRNRWVRARLRGKDLPPHARKNLTALDHLGLNQRAKNLRYVVFDLETTGLNPTRDRVLSLAAFRVVEGRILLGDVFNSLVNPERVIPLSAIKIHGIVPSMVAGAPSFEEVCDRFIRYLGTDILVGYHVRFDLRFLNIYMQQRYSFSLQNLVLDAQSMCRKIVFPIHPRTRQKLRTGDFQERIGRMDNLILIEPVAYLDFLCLMSNSALVMTDSGGVQEETTILRIP
ncbi:MAG: exonuclease domain-containing protein, partial [Desulfobacterales bacterium]